MCSEDILLHLVVFSFPFHQLQQVFTLNNDNNSYVALSSWHGHCMILFSLFDKFTLIQHQAVADPQTKQADFFRGHE